jgi:small subunit ribosomal protein S15
MARMHARRRGKSSSTKPFRTENPSWVPMSGTEIEDLILKLAKEGHSTSKIGIILRDQYGIPSVKLATSKKIVKILQERDHEFKLPEDLTNLIKKAVNLTDHLKDNQKDLHNKRNLHLVEQKIRRLVRYYIKNDVLPPDWEYSSKTAKLLVD